ncbi:MAG: DNA/RNA nuclease SfsA [Candidatus Baldrarchaeia archaeon]
MKLFEIKEPLLHATFKRRVNRFLVELNIGKNLGLAHLGNSGRLEELLTPNTKALLKKVRKTKKRKTLYDIIAVWHNNSWVLIDSRLHNPITLKILELELIAKLKGHKVLRKEVKVNNVRIDFLLEKDNVKCFLEVKGCTLAKNQIALFPDAPTERGRRQLDLLTKIKNKGLDAAILFLVLREDARVFSPNWGMDPQFSEKLKLAQNNGVKILACQVKFDGKNIKFVKELQAII